MPCHYKIILIIKHFNKTEGDFSPYFIWQFCSFLHFNTCCSLRVKLRKSSPAVSTTSCFRHNSLNTDFFTLTIHLNTHDNINTQYIYGGWGGGGYYQELLKWWNFKIIRITLFSAGFTNGVSMVIQLRCTLFEFMIANFLYIKLAYPYISI